MAMKPALPSEIKKVVRRANLQAKRPQTPPRRPNLVLGNLVLGAAALHLRRAAELLAELRLASDPTKAA